MINKRSEILFLYDVVDCNPNGDPLNDNMPRMDGEYCFVTDVSLKRKVRDYLMNFKNTEVFFNVSPKPDGTLITREERFAQFGSILDVLKNCVDIRLFGGVFPFQSKEKNKKDKKKKDQQNSLLQEEINEDDNTTKGDSKNKNVHLTGPVQFQYGRSLHKVSEPELVQITCVFPSKENKQQGTFGSQQIIKYALIGVNGIVNENIVKTEHYELVKLLTGKDSDLDEYLLSNNDIELLLEALWKGVKNTISCSKFGHTPRLLIQITYNEPDFYVGNLRSLFNVVLKDNVQTEEDIRSVNDYYLSADRFVEKLLKYQNKIEQINFVWDRELQILYNNSDFNFNAFGIPYKEIIY